MAPDGDDQVREDDAEVAASMRPGHMAPDGGTQKNLNAGADYGDALRALSSQPSAVRSMLTAGSCR